MKVRMLMAAGNAVENYAAKSVVEIDDALAANWIGAGVAEAFVEVAPVAVNSIVVTGEPDPAKIAAALDAALAEPETPAEEAPAEEPAGEPEAPAEEPAGEAEEKPAEGEGKPAEAEAEKAPEKAEKPAAKGRGK